MNTKSLLCALLVGSALSAFAARAAEQMVTEVLTIGYRTADELLPIIKPFVPPPGTVAGFKNQLVIKTTPSNLEEIKSVLATLDRAPANLLISVRNSISAEVRRDLASAFATVDAGNVQATVGQQMSGGVTISSSSGNSSAGVQVSSTSSSSRDRDVQRIRVLEGCEAFIQAGQQVPTAAQTVVVTGNTVTHVQVVEYQNVSRGFYVLPRLSGDRVTLQISQHRDTLSASGGGSIDTRSASTVISGRLGRWMEIGGVDQQQSSSTSGIAASTTSSGSSRYGIFIKVEKLN